VGEESILEKTSAAIGSAEHAFEVFVAVVFGAFPAFVLPLARKVAGSSF